MSRHIARAVVFDRRRLPQDYFVLLVFEEAGALSTKPDKKPHWRLPGGKCCESPVTSCGCSEYYEATAVRELKEEAGLDVSPVRLIHTHTIPDSGDPLHKRFYLLCLHLGGTLKQGEFEGTQTPAWFPVSGLPENMDMHHRRLIERAVALTMQHFEKRAKMSVRT